MVQDPIARLYNGEVYSGMQFLCSWKYGKLQVDSMLR